MRQTKRGGNSSRECFWLIRYGRSENKQSLSGLDIESWPLKRWKKNWGILYLWRGGWWLREKMPDQDPWGAAMETYDCLLSVWACQSQNPSFVFRIPNFGPFSILLNFGKLPNCPWTPYSLFKGANQQVSEVSWLWSRK